MQESQQGTARGGTKVLSVAGLRKSYGGTVAVDGVSFEVARGEIVGLLGPNGAGKTTTINMILGVLEPTASLDPASARETRTRMRQFAERGEGGVLWTSHNMYEVEEVCDRVLFLSKGRILLEGDPKTLPREHGRATLEELFIAVAREPLSLDGGGA